MDRRRASRSARSLGRLLVAELGWPSDGTTVADLDHLEIGRPVDRSGASPATTTSLVRTREDAG